MQVRDLEKGTKVTINKKSNPNQNEEVKNPEKKATNKEVDVEYLPLKYEANGKTLVFQRTSYDYKMICPNCKSETRYIVRHLLNHPDCQQIIVPYEFKKQFKTYKLDFTRELHIKRIRKYTDNQRDDDDKKVKDSQNKRKKESTARK